ncbi:hypothetical protein VULLAG_LOCUS12186 [Vulpes lagopus]
MPGREAQGAQPLLDDVQQGRSDSCAEKSLPALFQGAGHPRLAEPGPQGGARLTSHHGKRTAQESAEDGRAEPVLPGAGQRPVRVGLHAGTSAAHGGFA